MHALILALLIATPDDKGYPTVPLAKIASGTWVRPRAKITGTVAFIRKEDDGDVHIRLTSGKDRVILEIIPELPVSVPKIGDTITAWGVVRWDGEHRWAELHPLVGWRKEP